MLSYRSSENSLHLAFCELSKDAGPDPKAQMPRSWLVGCPEPNPSRSPTPRACVAQKDYAVPRGTYSGKRTGRIQLELMFTEHLLCARHPARYFTYIASDSPHNKSLIS